ncbi:3,4-dihydroxy-2-butanone 4-phosphate synthase [Candidatus Photodesmus katoptron]|uniref:3,4-dihydroxy-2-butanone-4-phosphate synthase n=1 Tax=Candidatus Photodesmus anomalopis TaxID=28176 RepID=UPI0004D632EF|nr:3,4-dihydroxy-2-butanone-4-phosphate synthase [Candidatus Photodesmus katoptron]KEY90277.1 3,4-dihydroxy-2-butanone 4-phosphate synthase [Candidatus Photodesmus katoptron]
MSISKTQEIIEDIRLGKMVILMDDESRENEGDLIIAAELITPEAINFMAMHGRGLICLTLEKERCEYLGLPPMVQNNNAPYTTNFTISIEAAKGVTTGISAADRAMTVKAAVAKNARPTDLVQPGHIFPLISQNGGVLTRAGHTEAGCDLARLAGFEAASVIVEILNEDGTMARRPDLEKFSQKHDIKLGTITDLIEYRNNTETTIERVAECKLPTKFGQFELFVFRDTINSELHYALKKGSLKKNIPLVRVHIQDFFSDILHSTRNKTESAWNIDQAMMRIAEDGGILVILGSGGTSDFLIHRTKLFSKQDEGNLNLVQVKKQDNSRRVGIGSQILSDLGVSNMRLLASTPQKYRALSAFGLSVVEYIYE